jgi:hypothetical protein
MDGDNLRRTENLSDSNEIIEGNLPKDRVESSNVKYMRKVRSDPEKSGEMKRKNATYQLKARKKNKSIEETWRISY